MVTFGGHAHAVGHAPGALGDVLDGHVRWTRSRAVGHAPRGPGDVLSVSLRSIRPSSRCLSFLLLSMRSADGALRSGPAGATEHFGGRSSKVKGRKENHETQAIFFPDGSP